MRLTTRSCPFTITTVVIGTVLALGVSLGPAAAATAAEPPITIPTLNGTTSESWSYSDTIIDPRATTLLVDGYAQAAGATVICTLDGADAPTTSVTYTAEQWNPRGPVELEIPVGALGNGSGDLRCDSRADTDGWSILWYLKSDQEEGAMNIIDQDDSRLLFYFNDTVFLPGPARVISPGSTVLLAGPWEYGAEENDGFAGATLTSTDPRFPSIPLSVSFNDSGEYGLLVQIPADLPTGFLASPATLDAESGSSGGGGNSAWRTRWSGTVGFGSAQATTTTSVSAERHYGVSRERMTVTAVVAAPTGRVDSGTVDFFLNSKLVGSSEVDASGHASFLLPKLPRGKHFVVATFRGTDAASSSTSTAAFVRILI